MDSSCAGCSSPFWGYLLQDILGLSVARHFGHASRQEISFSCMRAASMHTCPHWVQARSSVQTDLTHRLIHMPLSAPKRIPQADCRQHTNL